MDALSQTLRGYQTDTAFSRAFRRELGAPPAAWRRVQAVSRGTLGIAGTP